MTVFALHHAGGNRAVFDPVAELLTGRPPIQSLDLPGRGARRRDTTPITTEDAVNFLAEGAKRLLEGDSFIVVGHSMGAYLGQHLVSRLEQETGARCNALIVSSNAGPSLAVPLTSPAGSAIDASDEHVLEIARRFGDLPTSVSGNAYLRDAAIALMRRDFTLCDDLIRSERPILQCPIDVISGADDLYPMRALVAWRRETSADCRFFTVPGGHFHPVDHPEGLAARIRAWCREAESDLEQDLQ